MNIENELFAGYKANIKCLVQYGFRLEDKIYTYETEVLDGKFKIIVMFGDSIRGKIIDLDFNEEYTNFRGDFLGSFNASLKQIFIDLLLDIREKCFFKDVFCSLQAKRINDYIVKKYSVEPEFLWEKYPSFAIYRCGKKWFGLVASVLINKINKKVLDDREVMIINVKVNKDKLGDILANKNIYEAYHMNKKNWVTIILDDSLEDNIIEKMIDESYNLVK